MHILFLSHYFPPEVNAPASRTYEHCRQWVRDGHEVTVVTCVPNHPRGEVYEGYKNRLFQREQREGISVIRLWTYVTANEGFVKRTLNYISYMTSVMAAIPWLPRADVVISTSPQFFNGLAGYFVSRLKRIPWILEIRDLWPESILVVGAIKNKVIIKMLEYLEYFAYRKADRIVPVTEAFKHYMVGKGIPGAKIEVIKNGVDLGFYKSVEGNNPVIQELGLEGKFVASYFGTHGMAHHLETVLYAAQELRDHKEIVFLLVGDGAERNRLLKMREEMRLDNVIMVGQQPKEKMPYLWALSDVSMVLLKKSQLFKSVIPSKIFESMAMCRAIILGVEGESKQIIESAQAGFCIEPENSSELAARILELYRKPELGSQLGENGRKHVSEYYDRVVLARRYESLMSSLRTVGELVS
ncbi:MAG: glycosyltransferase family 4 protein [Sulfuricaulis sp.]